RAALPMLRGHPPHAASRCAPMKTLGEPEFRSTRRSFTTWLDAHGVSPDVQDRLIRHVDASVRGKHYRGETPESMARLAAAVSTIALATGEPDAESDPLRKGTFAATFAATPEPVAGGIDEISGGGEGIRTPGNFRPGGFRNRCLRPLGHSSGGWGRY